MRYVRLRDWIAAVGSVAALAVGLSAVATVSAAPRTVLGELFSDEN